MRQKRCKQQEWRRTFPLHFILYLSICIGQDAIAEGPNEKIQKQRESQSKLQKAQARETRSKEAQSQEVLPSEALLEFLAEFDNIDDETFNLLVNRGKIDAQKTGSDATEKPSEMDNVSGP